MHGKIELDALYSFSYQTESVHIRNSTQSIKQLRLFFVWGVTTQICSIKCYRECFSLTLLDTRDVQLLVRYPFKHTTHAVGNLLHVPTSNIDQVIYKVIFIHAYS